MRKFQGSPREIYNSLNGKGNTTSASGGLTNGRKSLRPNYTGGTAKTLTYFNKTLGEEVTIDMSGDSPVRTTAVPKNDTVIQRARGAEESSSDYKASMTNASELAETQAKKLEAQRARSAEIRKNPYGVANTLVNDYNNAVDAISDGRMGHSTAVERMDALERRAANLSAEMRLNGVDETADKGLFDTAASIRSGSILVGNYAERESREEAERVAAIKADPMSNAQGLAGSYATLASLGGEERDEYLREMQETAKRVEAAELKRVSGIYATLATLTDEEEAIEYLRSVSPELAGQREELVRLTTVNRNAGRQQFLNTLPDEEKLEYLKEHDPAAAVQLAGSLYRVNQGRMAALGQITFDPADYVEGKNPYEAIDKEVAAIQKEQQDLLAIMQMESTIEAFSKTPEEWKRRAEAVKAQMDATDKGWVGKRLSSEYQGLVREYNKYREYYYLTSSAETWSAMSEADKALAIEGAKELEKTVYRPQTADSVATPTELRNMDAADQRVAEIKAELTAKGYDADRVLTYASQYYHAAWMQSELSKTAEWASKNWATSALATVVSYATNLMSGDGTYKAIAHVAANANAGVEDYIPVDTNDPAFFMAKTTSAIRSEVASNMEYGSYMYNTVNSGIDNLLRVLVAKGVASGHAGAAANTAAYRHVISNLVSAQMSSQVFVNSFLEAKNAGRTDAEALTTSIASSAVEYLTELLPLEKIFSAPNQFSARALANAFGSEATEEAVAKLAGDIVDYAAYRSDADLAKEAQQYMNAGLSKSEAWGIVTRNYVAELIPEAFAGGLAGFGLSVGAQIGNNVAVRSEHSIETYKKATPQIVDAVLIVDPNNTQAAKVAEQIRRNGIDSVKSADIYKLVGQNPGIAQAVVDEVLLADAVENAAVKEAEEAAATQSVVDTQPNVAEAEAEAVRAETDIIQDTVSKLRQGAVTNAVYNQVYDAALASPELQAMLGVDLTSKGGLTKAQQRQAVKNALQSLAKEEAVETASADETATTVEAPAPTAPPTETEVTAEPTAEVQEAYAPKLKTTRNAVEAYKSGNMTVVRKFVSQAMNNEKIQYDLFPDGITATNNQEKRTAILERVKAFASGETVQVASSDTTTESIEEPAVVRPARSVGDYKKILSITEYTEQDGVRNLSPKAQSEAYRQYIKEVTSEITKDEKIQFLGKEVSFDEFHRIRGEMATAASKTAPTIMVDSVEFYQRYYDQLQLTDAVERVNETLSKAGFPTRARISYDREEFPEMNGIRENAFFDRVKNEIVFNGNVVTVRDIVGRRLGHELFHPGEQADEALVEETIRAFEELHKAGKLKGIRINLDGGMDAAAKRYQALYQRHENQRAKMAKRSAKTITIEDAKTELAADLFGELFHESSLAKEISGEKPNLAAKFATKLRDIRKKLGLPDKTDDIVATTIDSIVDKITTALKEKAEAGDGLKSVSHSISSTADAAGIEAIMDEESGRITFLDKDGNPVTEVTEDHIRDNSGFGMLISAAHDRGVITAREAEQQYKGVASIMNMIMKTQDPAMVWQFVGATMFSALKSNADGQYKTTIDFSTICRKTQDMITAMSRAMKEKGAGLTKDEVVALQQELHKAGSAVPCPVCYVFSRWAGIGAVLDKMAAWQDKYSGEYTAEELQKVIKDLSSKYENKSAIRMNLHKYDTEYQDVEHALENLVADAKQLKKDLRAAKKSKDDSAIRKIQRDIDVNATAQQIEKDRLKDLEDLAAGEVSWLKIVRTDPEYSPVDKDVLFDLDKADEFASRWPKSWKYRTTRGPSAGKAILPYSDMVLGDIILGVKHTAADGDDTFKETSGEMTPEQKKKYDAAVERVKAQNLIGGQRLQSTSDFRYDYALDYVLAFFELQALGSHVQTYTKVIEFADMVAAIGGDVNLSVMPRNAGYEDGKLIFSSITGIDYKVASEFASKHDSAQLILVGINDEHIRLALEDSAATGGDTIGFVIPYHASGASIENFIKHLVEQLGESYVSENYTDYSKVQNDSVRKGATTDQVRRNILRTQILTGRHKVWNEDTKQNTSKVWRPEPEDIDLIYGESVDISNRSFEDLRAVEKRALAGDKEAIEEYESWSAGVLNDLFHKLWDDGKPYSGVRLNGDQAKSIMPHEYWNPNTTRANAYVNGFIFRSYCYSLGLNPRFTGKDSNSKTVSYGDFSDSTGYWKTLIDRPMYRNDGTYRDQQAIKMTSFQKEMLKPEYASKKFGDAKIQEPSEARAVAAAEAFMRKQAEAKERSYSVGDNSDELNEFVSWLARDEWWPNYWYPSLTIDGWDLVNSVIEKDLGESFLPLDPTVKWVYASNQHTSVFAVYGTANSPDNIMYYACEGEDANDLDAIMEVWRDRYYINAEVLPATHEVQSNGNAPSDVADEHPWDERGGTDVRLPLQQPESDRQRNSFVRETIDLANAQLRPDRAIAKKIADNQHKMRLKKTSAAEKQNLRNDNLALIAELKKRDPIVWKRKNAKKPTKPTNAAYYNAVADNLYATADKMAETAARLKGYDTKGYHGTRTPGFTVVDGWLWTARDENVAATFGKNINEIDRKYTDLFDSNGVYAVYNHLGHNLEIDAQGYSWGSLPVSEEDFPGVYADEETGDITTNALAEWAEENQYDSITFKNIDDGGITTVDVIFNPGKNSKSAAPVTYDDAGDIVPIDQRFDSTKRGLNYSISEDIGYHAGDLGKSEHLGMISGDRDTGHFGFGTYFVGDRKKIEGYNRRNGAEAPVETVDFSQYHLYRPATNDDGFVLHRFLRSLNTYYDRDPNLVQTPEEYDQAKENIDDYRYEVEELGNTELEEQLIGVAESVLGKYGVARVVQGKLPVDAWLADDGTLELTDGTRLDIMEAVNMVDDVRDVNIAIYDEVANRWTESAVYRYDGWRYQVQRDSEDLFNLTPAEVDAIVSEIRDEIAAGNYNWETAKGQDSASTRFMKKLGYEGIDVRHLSQLDNTTYGSVIYDLKGDDLARKNEIGTARYSVSDAPDDTFRKDLAAIVEEAERYFADITSTDPDKELSADEQAAVNKLVKDLVKQASKAGKTEATRKYNAKLQERKQEYTGKLKAVKKAESMAQGREMTQQKRTLEAKAQAKYDKYEEKLAAQRESFRQKAEIAKVEADTKLDSAKLGEKMGHIRDMRQQKNELRESYESRMKAMKDEARSNLKLAVAVEKAKGEIVADNLRETVKETRETERAKANERLKRLRQINRNKAKAALRAQRSAAPKMTPKVTENADYITMREIAKPFQMSDLKNKETYTKAVQIAGEKLRWMGREAYRVFWSGAYAVENFANRQTGVRATSYATTLGSANVTVERIFKNGLVNKQGDIIGDSLAETLLVYGVVNKKGKVNNRKINLESMAIFQDYLLHAHNADRMSIEAKALAEVEAFIAENPVLEAMDEKEVGRIAALADKEAIAEGEIDTRDTVRRYLELLEKLNSSKNKAVFEDSEGNVITAETSRQRVEALEAQYPWLKEKAEGLYEWWDTFMREWVVGTSITEESYEAMREMYPHYVPTFRVVGKRGGSTGASTLSPRQVVKAAKGSTLSIIDIENSFARLVDTAVKSQRQNELFKNIIDTLVLDDGDERQFADIGYFDDSMFEDGAEAPTTADDAETEVSERIEEAQSAGLAKDKEGFKVSAWYNGELRSAYVSEDMYKGLQHLTGGNSNEIVKGIIRVGSALTKPMKTVITGVNPAFAVRNISRDLPTAIVNSISGVKFFKYWIQAGHDLVAAGVLNSEQLSKILAEVNFDFEKMEGSVERYQQYLNLGGGNATYYNDNAGFVKDIKGANWASRAVEKMGAFNEATETMTRYAEYLATIDKYGDSYESRLLGMRNAAEVTVDFSRHGVAGQVINAWIPYWNPAMQGSDKVVRSVIQSPEGKAWYNQALKTVGRASLTTVAVEALMLLVYAATGKRDEWEKLSDRVRDTYYCIPLRNGKFIRIPKNREWGAILGTPFMRLMDGLAGRDNPFENYVETSLVPNFLPSGITDMIIVSQANALDTNKDFAGRTIVPTQYLEGSKEMMYDADTSYLARGLAKLLGYKLGAMQIDYIISDYFGDFGDMAIQLFSPATWQRNPDETARALLDIVFSPWVSDNRYSNQTVSDYYELVDNMEMLAKDATNHGTIDEYQQTPDYLSYAAVTRLYGSQISDLNKQARNMADGAEKDAIKAEIARLASEAMSLDAAIRSGDFSVYASESTLFDSETTQTLLSLYATTKTSSIFLANPERIFSSDGKEFILTDEQFDIYSENRRNIAESILPGLLKSDAFNELSEEDKLKAISDAYNYASQLAKYNITGGEYEPAAWILSAAEYNESVGLPLDVVLTYRRLKSNIENQEGITNKKANEMVRSVFMSDDSLSATHKGALDEVLVSDITVIPEDKTIDYTTHETFVVSQMSESAQKRWPDIKKQFKISADQYQAAYIVYNNDDLSADEKKTEIGRIIGSKQKGIVLYKALGAKLDK